MPSGRIATDDSHTSALDGMSVTVHLEDSPTYVIDFSKMRGPEILRCETAATLLPWTTSFHGIRRTSSAGRAKRGLSAWLRWVEEWNAEHAEAEISRIADVTPFHLLRYQDDLEAKHTAVTASTYYGILAVMLSHAEGATAESLRQAGKRKHYSRPVSMVQRYPREEFTQIRNAARRIVRQAHTRIHAAHLEALRFDDPTHANPVLAEALHQVLMLGQPQSRAGFKSLGALSTRGYEQAGNARSHLFLTSDEVFAAAVLLACQRGLNLSPIVTADKPVIHDKGMVQLNLDKPRRGPKTRFWPEILDDDGADPGAASIVRMIAETTEAARVYLAANGVPTDRLLIRWCEYSISPGLGVPHHRQRLAAAWLPSGSVIDFRRLRRSIPDAGVAKQPTNHDRATYLSYVRTDPIALAEQQVKAALGVQSARDRAQRELHIKLREDEEVDPRNDALVVNCDDPSHHPVTHVPCTSGFFSFLDCLDCSNAATASRLLPRQLAAIQVLEELQDALGELWEKRFSGRYYTLISMTMRHSQVERVAAAELAPEFVPIILSALRHEVPK